MPWWIISYLKSAGSNFGEVVPGRIYRSAQPDSKRLVKLHDELGLQAVLNLRDDNKPEERAEVEAAGLLFYPVPMSDHAAPTDAQIRQALDVLRLGLVTLLHCVGGRHRSGTIAAVYRVTEQGWSKADAWKECEKFGWYDFGGHKPLRIWFEKEFDPARFPRK